MALVQTKLLVLNTIKYGDSSLIAKCYTESDGLRSYMLKGILTRKKGKIKKAHFQPLMQLEVIASHTDKESLDFIREVKIAYAYKTLFSDMYKNTLVYFIAEFLTNALKEETVNKDLYDYLAINLQLLDNLKDYGNFHLIFILNLTKYLGFYPDTAAIDATYFNLENGCFEDAITTNNSLTGNELQLFKTLLGITFDDAVVVRFTLKEKQQLIMILIRYFSVHLTTFKKLKSIAILHEVLHT